MRQTPKEDALSEKTIACMLANVCWGISTPKIYEEEIMKNFTRKLWLLALVLFSLGCALPALAAAPAPIKIGVYLPLTGQNAFGGQLELDGVQLAHKAMPTILDRPVELIVVDNKSDRVEAANAVKRLTERDKVVAIIGTYGSSLAMAGGEIAEKAKIPVVGTSCTNPLVTQGKEYYFRVCFIDPFQGAAAAAYAFKNLNLTRAALLVDAANDYATGLSSFFRRSFIKFGGEVVADLTYNSGDQDFTAQLTELINKKPEIVFMPAYFAEGAIIMKQARELGATFRIMGGDAMDNPDTLNIGGKTVEGFLHTTFPYDADMADKSEEAKAFTVAWQQKFPNKEPNVNAALGYNAYFLIMDAIKRAGTAEPEAITTALAATKDLPTALGKLTINATQDAEMPVGIIEYIDGKRVYLGEITVE